MSYIPALHPKPRLSPHQIPGRTPAPFRSGSRTPPGWPGRGPSPPLPPSRRAGSGHTPSPGAEWRSGPRTNGTRPPAPCRGSGTERSRRPLPLLLAPPLVELDDDRQDAQEDDPEDHQREIPLDRRDVPEEI